MRELRGTRGRGFYSRSSAMDLGERRMEIEGRSEARALHPTAHAWLRGRGTKGTRLGDSRDPLAHTCHAGRGLVGGVIGVGEEDDTVAGGG